MVLDVTPFCIQTLFPLLQSRLFTFVQFLKSNFETRKKSFRELLNKVREAKKNIPSFKTMLDVPAEMNEDAIDVAPVVASSNLIDDRLAEFHTFHLVHVSTLVEKKTSCKTIMKNVYLARLWQKRQILQESGTKVISCKNRSKNFLQDLLHYADKNSAANSEVSMAVNIEH